MTGSSIFNYIHHQDHSEMAEQLGLGLSEMVEMTGSSVFDYIHHQDHSEMAEQLGLGLSEIVSVFY
ncbi:hypothetical protein J6590_012903 [Homalodisca vitripennis]|nr:hypothetical protein J6590_012903 [Homalodisca vitripennis]